MRRPVKGGERARCAESGPHALSSSPRATAGAGTMSTTNEAAQPQTLGVSVLRAQNASRRIRRGWLVRRAFYESALDQIATLHALPESVCIEMKEHLPAEFNAELYGWEQNYFFENCLGRYFGMDEAQWCELATLPPLRKIADQLARLPRVLVHRDFQSQNIIIRNSLAYLIDFQGMRPGLPEYDLASLLFDPYVDPSKTERDELICYYREKQAENGRIIDGEFDEILRLCAMQRLMQALGAYGFLGLVKGHKHFLKHVPAAMTSLAVIVSEIGGLEKLNRALIESARK